jgi:capsular polysaccharide biosynthesis protein
LQAIQTHESELVELTRDYSAIQDVYANLLMKSQELAVAADLERRKIGEQFRLVDEPSKPERPDNQRQRLTILASGAVAGLVFGLLIVGLLEYRDSSFGRAEEVHEALSVPVLASIPVMNSDRQCQAARRRRRAMDVGGAAALVAAVMVLALWGP